MPRLPFSLFHGSTCPTLTTNGSEHFMTSRFAGCLT